jgi:pyruvate dehydrogenase E1 component beta subunit
MYTVEGEVPEKEYTIPLGAAELKRTGSDVSIVTYSKMVHTALAAAEELSELGVDAEVVDLRTLKPLDTETILKSIKKTHRAVVLHEACVTCGYGAEIAAQIAEHGFSDLHAPVKRLGIPDTPIPYAESLEMAIIPDQNQLIDCVKSILQAD